MLCHESSLIRGETEPKGAIMSYIGGVRWPHQLHASFPRVNWSQLEWFERMLKTMRNLCLKTDVNLASLKLSGFECILSGSEWI